MEVFINEDSLHEQYELHDIEKNVRVFLTAVHTLNSLSQKRIYRSSLLFNSKAIRNSHLGATLKHNFELNSVFLQNLKNASTWEEEQLHPLDSLYEWYGMNVTGRSIAEVCERNIVSSPKRILLNFPESIFADANEIFVDKDKTSQTLCACAFNQESLIAWLIKFGVITKKYDPSDRIPPQDFQTILANDKLFEITKWRNGKYGRRVYRLKGSNQLWCVDNSLSHTTILAHLEIFDEKTKMHLGTSLYDRLELNTTFQKRNRSINLV